MSGGDFITVLRSAGPLLAKRWGADGRIEPYGNALQVRPIEHAVGDLAALHDQLQRLAGDARSCVVRGRFVGTAAAAAALAGDPKADGLRDGYTLRRGSVFIDVPHHWVMLDVDGFVPATADPVLQPEAACLEFIRAKLPEAFWDVSFVWHLSGSAGHTKSAGKLKCHLWFWLSAACSSAELRAWARSVPGIDLAVFQAVQPHFVADPVMSDGVVDPVPRRLGFAQGPLDDVVHLEIDGATLAAARAAEARERRPMTDPGDKPGLVGAFCRRHMPDDLADLLPGEFEIDDERTGHFSWVGHDNPGGVYVTACGHGLVSTHGTAPTGQNRRRNIADFTRMHLFGHLDDGLPDDTALSVRPSYAQWKGWVKAEHPGVWAEFVAEVREDRGSAEADFGALDDGGADAVPDAQAQPRAGDAAPPGSGAAADTSSKAGAVRKLKIWRYADLKNRPAPKWLVRGWWPEQGVGILYGEANSGKTLVILDLLLAVASGRPWHGMPVQRGPALLIALEGAAGLRHRVEAWGQHHGMQLDGLPFGMVDATLDLRTSAVDVQAAADAARVGVDGCPAKIVVIDTLSKALNSGDENSAQDVTKVLRAAEMISRAAGCFVLVLHHAGKDLTRGARGHSSLRGDVDVMVELRKGPGGGTLRLDKQREGPTDLQLGFRLQQVSLGQDDEGAPVASAVAVPCAAPARGQDDEGARSRRRPLGPREALLMSAVSEARGFDDEAPTEAEVIAAAVNLAGEDAPRRANLRSTLNKMIDRGVLVNLGGRISAGGVSMH